MKVKILFLVCSFLIACLPVKKLERDVNVLLKANFNVVIQNTGTSSFSKKYTEEEYKKQFINELTKSLSLKRIIVSENATEYIIEIDTLRLTESTSMDTIKNIKSPDNGRVYELSKGKAFSFGRITLFSNPAKNSKWSGEESRREKFTSFRNVEEIVKGNNADGNQYREKRFGEYEYLQMVNSCAFSAAESITRKIKNNLKY